MSEWVEGRVERVLWAADDGGWAVLRVRTAEGSTIVVGPLGAIAQVASEEPFASFEGSFEQHASHGRQFKATGALLGSPRTEAGIRLYLASSGVKGVGPLMADRIVDHFGVATTRVLEREPERLAEVEGIGVKRAAAVARAWQADAGGRALTILLRGLGVSARLVGRIRERYGDEAHAVVSAQPYRLAEEVRGIGFQIADQIARNQGLALDHPDRLAAAVRHVVQRGADDGHCLLPRALVVRGLERLGVAVPDLDAVLDVLVAEGRLEEVDGEGERAVAVPFLAEAERRVAGLLAGRLEAGGSAEASVDELVRLAEGWSGITLDPSQRDAVGLAASHGVTVVTGGPGTGKTTLVRVLLRVARERGETWALASPTGRAAKRLSEATGQEASTLHRLLEFQPGTNRFGRNAGAPLEIDGLVVDEMSMVDVHLMAALLDALPWERPCRLVLVGDADQLPSVGAGQVLRDLVDAGVVPVARLSVVHRQGDRSRIVEAASEIHHGRVPSSDTDADGEFFVVRREDPSAVVEGLIDVVAHRLPRRGYDPMEDVVVLSPTRKGALGTAALNEALRDALNPSQRRLKVGPRSFAEGDRVIATRNRYDLGVFNGDLGRVESVSPSELLLRFDEVRVPWPREELDEIELAYALTVHKSQGSEYSAVVLVLHRAHGIMLRRNLLYTAVTRARRFFCLLGDGQGLARAVKEQHGDVRHTRLVARLRESVAFLAGPG